MMKKETRGNFVYRLSATAALVFLLALAGLTTAEAYVRWSMNQNFSFLGGSGLLGLGVVALGLVLGLIYSQKS